MHHGRAVHSEEGAKLESSGTPPTFLYLLALMVWIVFACLVWLAAGLLSLVRRTRCFARPLCLAMAGTFPFVFVYQVAVAPLVAGILLAAWAFWKILEPGDSTVTQNPLVIGVSIAIAFLSFGAMLVASLAGFYEGWRFGWSCGKGQPWRDAIREGRTTMLLHRLLPDWFLGRWWLRAQG